MTVSKCIVLSNTALMYKDTSFPTQIGMPLCFRLTLTKASPVVCVVENDGTMFGFGPRIGGVLLFRGVTTKSGTHCLSAGPRSQLRMILVSFRGGSVRDKCRRE